VTAPAALSSLTATVASSTEINLAWTDNSAVEDGYEVRRSIDAVQFSVVASLPANSATYSDRAVSGNVTYSYVVAAKRDGGFSDFSTVASARTGLVTRGGIVTWGNTMMKFSGSSAFRTLLGDDGGATDDYILARNMLQHLSGKTSNVRILYTDTCDPRTDPEVCHVGGLEYLQPFYDMIATIGTITYGDMASVQLADFDVLIADFCSLPSQEYDMLKSYLSSGGPAMVLADNFCVADEYSTAYLANTVMHDLGVTFSDYELIEYERFQIPNSDQVGLLTGVSNLSLWRLTPQFIIYDFVPVATWDGNVLYTIHEGTFARQVAAAARVTGKATTGRHRARGPAPPSTGPGPSLVGKLANGERVLARN